MVEVVKRMRVEGNDMRGRDGCEKKEMVVRSCVEKILFIEVYVVCERATVQIVQPVQYSTQAKQKQAKQKQHLFVSLRKASKKQEDDHKRQGRKKKDLVQ